jgi:hypothetical protein
MALIDSAKCAILRSLSVNGTAIAVYDSSISMKETGFIVMRGIVRGYG